MSRARAGLIRICIYEKQQKNEKQKKKKMNRGGHSLCGVSTASRFSALLPVAKNSSVGCTRIMGRENSKASTKSGLLIASRPAHFEVKTLGQPIVISVCGDSAGGSRKKQLKIVFHVSCYTSLPGSS